MYKNAMNIDSFRKYLSSSVFFRPNPASSATLRRSPASRVVFRSGPTSCAFFRPGAASPDFLRLNTSSCAIFRKGLSCAFLCTGRRYIEVNKTIQITKKFHIKILLFSVLILIYLFVVTANVIIYLVKGN